MQVELQNFRCWKKQSFQFNDKGIILINGTSGSGKSSILNAIFFAITGIGSKIVSYGEKKCCVKLSFNDSDIKEITRTKSPCRLTVKLKDNSIYEDDEAQKIIDKYFGNNFQQTSYMTQKMIHSFLSLSAAEKMNFLQKYVMDNSDPNNNTVLIKKKCKDKISELKKISIEHKSKISLYENELKILENKLHQFIPLTSNINEYFKKVSKIQYNPCHLKDLRNNQNVINELYQKYNEYKIKNKEYNIQKENLLNEINEYQINKLVLQNKTDHTEYRGDKYYEFLNECKSYYILQIKYDNLINDNESKFNNLFILINEQISFYKSQNNTIEEKKNHVYNNLLSVYKDIEYIKNNIEKWNKSTQTVIEYYNFIKENKLNTDINNGKMSVDDIILMLSNLKINVEELKQKLEIKQEQLNKLKQDWNLHTQLHKCPKCNISLKFKTSKKDPSKQILTEDTNVTVDPDTYKKNLKLLQEEIELLSKDIDDKQKEIYDKESLKNQLINYNTKIDNLLKRINRADPILLIYMDFKSVDRIENSTIVRPDIVQTKINNINKWLEEYYKYMNEISNNENLIDNINIFKIIKYDKNNLNEHIYVTNLINIIKTLVKKTQNESIVKLLKLIQSKLTELNVIITNNTIISKPLLSEQGFGKLVPQQDIDFELMTQTKHKSDYEHNTQQLLQIKNKYVLLNDKLSQTNENLKNIQEFLNINENIQDKYNNILKELDECYKLEEEYNKYNSLYSLYEDWKRLNNENRLQNYLYDNVSNDIVVHEIFLNKINETESITLTHCIDSINYYINDYLEKFFPNDSINVDIVSFKEKIKNGKSDTSEIKPGIDIKVCYKGEEVELSSLSGGEYDRVSLSIMLSFNHICKNDMILLDESIASLDAELTNDILEKLKESLTNKRIIVVAHQLSTGIFDQIVNTK